MKHIGALLLAAGASSRMGQSKQLLDIHGQTLLARTTRTILASDVSKVVVLLGSQQATHKKSIDDLPVDIVVNKKWEKGMGTSIIAGMQHLTKIYTSMDGVIISVCDQPLLSREHINNLISGYRNTSKSIIASQYAEIVGVPALFHRNHFKELLSLSDNEGARKIIMQYPDAVFRVPFPGGEIDLDTPEDYEIFISKSHEM